MMNDKQLQQLETFIERYLEVSPILHSLEAEYYLDKQISEEVP
ncbi:hypothetical protein ACWE42_22315 [Sutcliffiella cohnii]